MTPLRSQFQIIWQVHEERSCTRTFPGARLQFARKSLGHRVLTYTHPEFQLKNNVSLLDLHAFCRSLRQDNTRRITSFCYHRTLYTHLYFVKTRIITKQVPFPSFDVFSPSRSILKIESLVNFSKQAKCWICNGKTDTSAGIHNPIL